MKTFLSLLSLLSLAALLSITGCASENDQGGSYDSTESSHQQYTSPQAPPKAGYQDDYWGRGPWY